MNGAFKYFSGPGDAGEAGEVYINTSPAPEKYLCTPLNG